MEQLKLLWNLVLLGAVQSYRLSLLAFWALALISLLALDSFLPFIYMFQNYWLVYKFCCPKQKQKLLPLNCLLSLYLREKKQTCKTNSALLISAVSRGMEMAVSSFRRFSASSARGCSNVAVVLSHTLLIQDQALWSWCMLHLQYCGLVLAIMCTWLLFRVVALKAILTLKIC